MAVPGVLGLGIRLFPSLTRAGSLLYVYRLGAHPTIPTKWEYMQSSILLLGAVCAVAALILWLSKSLPMWRWAFTWATLGYLVLLLVGQFLF